MHETDPTLLSAAMCFAASASAFAQREDDNNDTLTPEIKELLSIIGNQREWRVFVDGTRNLGHQASSITLVRRMIDLTSFKGCIVIVYADYGRAILGSTIEKLALMFTGLDPTRIEDCVVSYGTCRSIKFLSFDCRSELSEPVAFGFTGGSDDMSVNYSLELKVRFFVRLQPFLWDDEQSSKSDPYYESSRIEQPDGRYLYLVDAYPEFRHLAIKNNFNKFETIDPSVWKWYGEAQNFDVGLAHRTRNIRSICTLVSNDALGNGEAIRFWPLYGLQHFRDYVPELFLVIVLCALQTQANQKKPIVLLSFSPHQELIGWSELIQTLANDLSAGHTAFPSLRAAIIRRYNTGFSTGKYSEKCLELLVCAIQIWLIEGKIGIGNDSLEIHHCYDVASGQWVDISNQLLNTLAGDDMPKVHVVEVGQVAMDVFQYCLTHSDLPCVIEGQATSNLMMNLGHPFLQILRSDHVIKNGYINSRLGSDALFFSEKARDVGLTFRDLQIENWLTSDTLLGPNDYLASLNTITTFIREVCNTNSELYRYFKSIGHLFSKNANDKLLISLLALREVIFSNERGD